MTEQNNTNNSTVYYTDVEEGTADESKDKSKVLFRKKFFILVGSFLAIAISVVIISIVLINVFNVNYVKVSGNSMQPTFSTNDGVFISTTDDDPQRDDLAVFVTPPSWMKYTGAEAPRYFVKRAVGIPGDQVEFSAEGVRVDGESAFLNDAGIIECDRETVSGTLDNDEYLLLGDNHNFSSDAYRLYCAGAGFDEVIVDREMVHYHGDQLFVIGGGWGWFESYSDVGQEQ